jgi:uncharacterized iron-regulated membrane protein
MRRLLVQTHRWLGLTVGLLWALQGFSGAVLVFHRELDRIGGPATAAGPMASLDAMLGNATKAAGGSRIVRLSIVDRHRDLIDATYSDRTESPRSIVIDASTAQVVGARDMEPTTPFSGSATRWVLMFHMSLLSGRTGEIFIGISGVLLLSAAIMGLRVAWPQRRGWKAVYAFQRWRKALSRLYGWHRAIGLTAGLIVTTIALSGICMTFEEDLRPALARIVPHQLAYRPAPIESLGKIISPQAALDIAQRRLPQARWVRVTLPKAAEPVYTIRFHQRAESRAWMGRTTVTVDAATGRIDSVYDPTTAPVSNRIMDALLPLHDGELLGLAGRILMLLTGLSLPALYVTGIWRWFATTTQAPYV